MNTRSVLAAATLLLVVPAATLAAPKPPPPPVDSCLVGTWKTTSVASLATIDDGKSGGGVILKISGAGQEAVDYDAMGPLQQPVGPLFTGQHFYRGTATALFATPTPGHPKLVAMLGSNVATNYPNAQRAQISHPLGKTLGPGGLGNDPNGTYRCAKASLEVSNTAYTFRYARLSSAPPQFAGGANPQKSSTPPGPFNPLPGGQFCVQNAGAIADTSPCTGSVKPSGFPITLRLKKQIPAPVDAVKFYTTPLASTSGVLAGIAGSGTTVNSDYTITAPPSLCMNTGTKYAIRVFIGGTSYGDVGIFWPDCR